MKTWLHVSNIVVIHVNILIIIQKQHWLFTSFQVSLNNEM